MYLISQQQVDQIANGIMNVPTQTGYPILDILRTVAQNKALGQEPVVAEKLEPIAD
jgi:hypothetical protein